MATIDDLKETFFEESLEGLQAIETGLHEFSDAPRVDEAVNAVFRGIHSIKGGAGVFGFESLVGFAHVFETVLDALRHGKLSPSAHVVDVLLKANDTLSDLVQMARVGQQAPPGFDADSVEALKELIAAQGGLDASTEDAADFSDIEFTPVLAEDTAPDSEPSRGPIGIECRPKQARFDEMLVSVCRELREAGELEIVADTSRLPGLDELDPATAYLTWQGTLDSVLPVDKVRKIIAQVDPDEDWEFHEIEELPAAISEAEVPQTISVAEDIPIAPTEPPDAKIALPAVAPERFDPSHPKTATSTTIRVDLEKIDRVVNMVGELVISQTMLGQLFQSLEHSANERLIQIMEDVFLHTRELKNSVMAMRAQPVRSVFQRMSRLVRELSVKTGKKIQLETSGESTEVDKTVIERLSDPLTHIIRNAVDHGIETPERRLRSGKPEEGTIHLAADQRSSRIVIEIRDDGAGIDAERVVKKARDRGLIPAEGQLSEEEINNLIFLPGFSTAENVSDISGRGVGMDVVRRNIQELGGRISLKSSYGKGMSIQLTLPLTLAVMDGMIVKVGKETYVMPIPCIIECIRPARSEIRSLLGTRGALRVRGSIVPLVDLSELFDIPADRECTEETTVIIIETSEGVRLGIVVNQLCGHQQVVIKSIEENYRAVPGIAGATILGDGRVAFILDGERLGDLVKSTGIGSMQPETTSRHALS